MRLFDLIVRWLRRVVGQPTAPSRLRSWAQDWRRYARLDVEALEQRLPPGSLLGLAFPLEDLGLPPIDCPPPAPQPAPAGTLVATTGPTGEVPLDWAPPDAAAPAVVTTATVSAAPPTGAADDDLAADLAFLAGLDGASTGLTEASAPPATSTPPSGQGTPTAPTTDAPGGASTSGTAPALGDRGGDGGGPWDYETGEVTFVGVRNLAGAVSETATNDTTPTLVGTGTPGHDVRLTLAGGATYSAAVGDDGRWEATVATTLAEGWHRVDVELLDDGFAVGSTTANFQVDVTPPTATLTVDQQYLVERDPTFQVAVEDGRSREPLTVVFDIDRNKDGDYADADEAAQVELSALSGETVSYAWADFQEGNPDVRVRVRDAAGNAATSNTVEVFKAHVCDEAHDHDYSDDEEYWNSIAGVGGEGRLEELPGDEGGGGGGGGVMMFDTFVNETEPNNTIAAANAVTVANNNNTFIAGGIGTSGDVDVFSFVLGARSGVFFDVDSRETGLSTTFDSIVTVFNSAGTQVTNGTNDDGYDFDTGWPAPLEETGLSPYFDSGLYLELAAGTYYAQVTGFGSATGNYNFRIRPEESFASTAPALSSLPGAAKTIYLDFDGHAATDAWGTYNVAGYDINGSAAEFSPGEQLAIRNVWRTISEDYSPFNINVTTVAPAAFNANVMRVVFTNNNGSAIGVSGALGVAFLNSFSSAATNDNTSWVFAQNFDQSFFGGVSGRIMATALEMGNTAAHEVGHTLGLRHYGGTNAGANTNGIMFTPDSGLSREIWRTGPTHNGEPPVVSQDDMAVISNTTNGFGYRTDDHGNTLTTATTMSLIGTTAFGASGIISQVASDVDWFKFRGPTTFGTVTVSALVHDYINDLRPAVFLRDSLGNVISSAAGLPSGDPNFDAVLTANLGDQDYYVSVASGGNAGEAGQYDLVINLPNPPTFPPTPPPGGGGGGGGGPPVILPGDSFENNDTSAEASLRGSLTATQTYTALTINIKDGLPDYDWFRWTAGATGTLTATTTTTSGGDIELSLWRLDGSTLVSLSADTRPGVTVRQAAAAVTAGQTYLVQVKGRNSSPGVMDQATYNLTAVIA